MDIGGRIIIFRKCINRASYNNRKEMIMPKTVVQTLKNGPYLVNGEIEIKDAEGNIIPCKKDANALCRCGGSAGKPFCDGAHVKANFKA